MGTLVLLARAVMIPVVLLNMLGGGVAGVWLMVLGDWGSLGWGVGAMMLGAIAVSIALLPGLLLSAPALACLQRGWDIPGYGLLLLSSAYTSVVMVTWCLGALLFFGARATPDSAIPLLLWSFVVGTGIWARWLIPLLPARSACCRWPV